MHRFFCSLLITTLISAGALAATYEEVPNWYKLAPGRPQMGNMHGDIAVSAKGEIYVSVQDPQASMQVYGADGQFLRVVPNVPPDFHGFVIHKEEGGEFIYGPRLGTGEIFKITLEGEVVLKIDPAVIPEEFKNKGALKLTGMDVAPNGDLYVTDGYGLDYVHHFDKTGKYLGTFGGRKEPYNFSNLHKIAMDTRFSPVRIVATDRGHNRLVHLSLAGELLGEVAKDLRKPSALFPRGDELVVGELNGRVSVLDKEGKTVATMGTNETAGQFGTNRVEPDLWKTGLVNSPHGVVCDAQGNILVSEWNLFGRIHKFEKR